MPKQASVQLLHGPSVCICLCPTVPRGARSALRTKKITQFKITQISGGHNWAVSLSDTLPLKHGRAYSEVFGFFRQKITAAKPSPIPKSLFENTMGNSFFQTPFFGGKTL